MAESKNYFLTINNEHVSQGKKHAKQYREMLNNYFHLGVYLNDIKNYENLSEDNFAEYKSKSLKNINQIKQLENLDTFIKSKEDEEKGDGEDIHSMYVEEDGQNYQHVEKKKKKKKSKV